LLTTVFRGNAAATDPDLAEFNLDKYDEEIAADQEKSEYYGLFHVHFLRERILTSKYQKMSTSSQTSKVSLTMPATKRIHTSH
jgi:hypothetical protein